MKFVKRFRDYTRCGFLKGNWGPDRPYSHDWRIWMGWYIGAAHRRTRKKIHEIIQRMKAPRYIDEPF
jgi:hypothetical protein